MSCFSPILIALLISFSAATVQVSEENEITRRRIYMEKLNDYISLIDQGFGVVAKTVRELRKVHRIEDNLYVRLLSNLHNSKYELKVRRPACRKGWTEYGKMCFLFLEFRDDSSPDTAKKTCEKHNAYLARCTSPEQQDFFRRSVNADAAWIILGGTDRNKDGVWRWPDGLLMKANYTNWRAGHPVKGENCMYIPVRGDKWESTPCSSNFSPSKLANYVCEMAITFA